MSTLQNYALGSKSGIEALTTLGGWPTST